MAVPLFFMISGFFIVNDKGEVSINRLWNSIKKIFKINLIATCVYLLYSFLVHTLQYILTGSTDYIAFIFPDDFLAKLLLANPYVGVLWYLVAYMQALLIILISVYYKKFSILLKIFPLFFLIGLFMGTYNIWYPFEELYFHRNFLTMALPFVILGAWIKINQEKYLHFSNKPYFLAFAILLAYIEYMVLAKLAILDRGDYYFSIILLSIAVFLFFIHFPDLGKKTTLLIIGRDFSLFIYLYHCLFRDILDLVCFKLGCPHFSKYNFLIVLPLTVFIAYSFKYAKSKILRDKKCSQ